MNFECFFDIESNFQAMFNRKLKKLIIRQDHPYLKVLLI